MDVWLNKFHLGIIELDSFRFYTAEKRASDCVKPNTLCGLVYRLLRHMLWCQSAANDYTHNLT